MAKRTDFKAGIRFLDPSGESLQVVVSSTANSVLVTELHFDYRDVPPIEGDPDELLLEWQKRLGLKIDENGEVVSLSP